MRKTFAARCRDPTGRTHSTFANSRPQEFQFPLNQDNVNRDIPGRLGIPALNDTSPEANAEELSQLYPEQIAALIDALNAGNRFLIDKDTDAGEFICESATYAIHKSDRLHKITMGMFIHIPWMSNDEIKKRAKGVADALLETFPEMAVELKLEPMGKGTGAVPSRNNNSRNNQESEDDDSPERDSQRNDSQDDDSRENDSSSFDFFGNGSDAD